MHIHNLNRENKSLEAYGEKNFRKIERLYIERTPLTFKGRKSGQIKKVILSNIICDVRGEDKVTCFFQPIISIETPIEERLSVSMHDALRNELYNSVYSTDGSTQGTWTIAIANTRANNLDDVYNFMNRAITNE